VWNYKVWLYNIKLWNLKNSQRLIPNDRPNHNWFKESLTSSMKKTPSIFSSKKSKAPTSIDSWLELFGLTSAAIESSSLVKAELLSFLSWLFWCLECSLHLWLSVLLPTTLLILIINLAWSQHNNVALLAKVSRQ